MVVVSASACTVGSPAKSGTDANAAQADAPAGGDDAAGADASAPGDAVPADAHVLPIDILIGADRASAFSAAEAHALHTSLGVVWTGVYIGGACSAGSGWTKALLASLASAEGWTFMPIWVGQESPSICSHDTLTAAQGTTDGKAAAAEMAAFGWAANQNIPVVLDLEAGTYTYSTADATAYATAWRDAVRAAGYLAYLYSSYTAIDAMYDGGVAFDGAWPAVWEYTAFESTVKPSGLTDLGTRYDGSNRAWQYAGSVSTTEAGEVDADVSDLLLAPAPGGTNL